MNDLDRTQLLEVYKNGPSDLQQALAIFPSEMWRFKPTPDNWGIHEIVVHLADTEVQSHVRIRTIISEPSTTLPNYDEYQMTPASVHEGRAEEIYTARQVVLDRAFQAHPERFSKGRPKPPKLPEPAWINPPKKEIAA